MLVWAFWSGVQYLVVNAPGPRSLTVKLSRGDDRGSSTVTVLT